MLHRRLTQVSFVIATRDLVNFVCMIKFECDFSSFSLNFKAGFVDTLYSWSAFNTEEIGNVIAESLKILIRTYPIEKIHLIGECEQ